MNPRDAYLLLQSEQRGSVDGLEIAAVLRSYFHSNADMIWKDTLATHGLLSSETTIKLP